MTNDKKPKQTLEEHVEDAVALKVARKAGQYMAFPFLLVVGVLVYAGIDLRSGMAQANDRITEVTRQYEAAVARDTARVASLLADIEDRLGDLEHAQRAFDRLNVRIEDSEVGRKVQFEIRIRELSKRIEELTQHLETSRSQGDDLEILGVRLVGRVDSAVTTGEDRQDAFERTLTQRVDSLAGQLIAYGEYWVAEDTPVGLHGFPLVIEIDVVDIGARLVRDLRVFMLGESGSGRREVRRDSVLRLGQHVIVCAADDAFRIELKGTFEPLAAVLENEVALLWVQHRAASDEECR
jgi:hypothetical protein